MREKIMYDGEKIIITDEHASSSYGQPVAIYHGHAYGVSDMPPGEEPLVWLREKMGKTVAVRTAHRTRGPLTARYVETWLEAEVGGLRAARESAGEGGGE